VHLDYASLRLGDVMVKASLSGGGDFRHVQELPWSCLRVIRRGADVGIARLGTRLVEGGVVVVPLTTLDDGAPILVLMDGIVGTVDVVCNSDARHGRVCKK